MVEEKEAAEIRKFLSVKPEPKEKEVSIIYDGKQFSVRIPQDFASVLEIDPKKDRFRFKLEIPPFEEGEKQPKLRGELVQGD